MNIFQKTLLCLLLAVAPIGASGSLTFGGIGSGDWIDCGSVDFDGTWSALIIWVTPNFADTDTTERRILDSYTGVSPTANGIKVAWGTGNDFYAVAASSPFDIGVSCVCGAFPTCDFAAGDLVGLYFSFANNVQQCTVYTPRTGRASTGSGFFGLTYRGATANLKIGDSQAGGQEWEGEIHQIVMTNTALFNTNLRHLVSVKKQTFYPMWATSPSEQPGETFVDYVAGWNFETGNVGDTLGISDVLVDITGGGNNCNPAAGSAIVGAGTPMLR